MFPMSFDGISALVIAPVYARALNVAEDASVALASPKVIGAVGAFR